MLAPYETSKCGELRAVAFKVVIEPEAEPERVIHVVKELKDTFRIGRVISIGSEANEKLPELAIGDRVLYSQSVSCTTAVKDRHIVHHDHILCIVEPGVTTADLEARIVDDRAAAPQIRVGPRP